MERLRETRKQLGYTMKFIAQKVGVTESAISQYETGKRQPDFLTVSRLADFLGVSVDYLLGRDDSETETQEDQSSDRIKQFMHEAKDLSEHEIELVRMFMAQVKKNRK